MRETVGAYIHFPFCVKKCYYCDFYSIVTLSGIDKFVDSLIKEIELRAVNFEKEYDFDTVFFGGGTPSLLSPKHLERILKALRDNFAIRDGAEITLECNPNSADAGNFADYKSLGVNRVSVGVQSFIPKELEFLQRIHSPEEAQKAIQSARNVFDNLNLDLMFAVPGQTLESLNYNLDKALELGTDHVSAYSLIFEEGTGLYKALEKGNVKQTDEDTDSDFYYMVCDKLKAAGFEHYEVSNFAKPGKKCEHNRRYWRRERYAAFGPSAHGYIENTRYKNVSNLGKYNKALLNGELPGESIETISEAQSLEEYIFLGLRAEGVDLNTLMSARQTGLQETGNKLIESLIADKLAFMQGDVLRLSSAGYWLCDEITVRFMEAFE